MAQGRPKRVLCIMDMAGVGRSSLAAVLPILAACGVQGCPLPAVLFSTHTGGFGPVQQQDTVAFATEALAHYIQLGLAFDAIYIGYLLTPGQLATARQALEAWPDALHVVDPALGDDGRLYTGIGAEVVSGMRQLCKQAGLVTPNLTESALLLGKPPGEAADSAEIAQRLGKLSAGGGHALITSVHTPAGALQMCGCGPCYSEPYTIDVHPAPRSYPGTGDAFTAAVVGSMLAGGCTVQAAAQKAGAFVEAAAQATYQGNGEARHGLWFEPSLPLLHP